MTREELIEVMARAIHEERQKAGFGGEASWEHEPKSIHALHLHTATAALAAIEAAGVRLVYLGEAPAQLIDNDERTTVRIFTPYAPPGG